jgi:selenophosphate synthetase-related protein
MRSELHAFVNHTHKANRRNNVDVGEWLSHYNGCYLLSITTPNVAAVITLFSVKDLHSPDLTINRILSILPLIIAINKY